MGIKSIAKNVWGFIFNQKFFILFAFLTILMFIFFPYYHQFGGYGWSDSTTKWGEYGDYLSGVASFINLILLIAITYYVANLDRKNSKEQLETQRELSNQQLATQRELNEQQLETQRELNEQQLQIQREINNQQLETQKKILVVDYKQFELNKISEQLDKFLDGFFDFKIASFRTSLQIMMISLSSIVEKKVNVFEILKDEKIKNIIKEISDLKDLVFEATKGINNANLLNKEKAQQFVNSSLKIIEKKNLFIRELQESIFKEL